MNMRRRKSERDYLPFTKMLEQMGSKMRGLGTILTMTIVLSVQLVEESSLKRL